VIIDMSSLMRTFKLTLAYDGTSYFGWQVQPKRPTIQSELQKAIATIVSQPVSVVGSGRTDTGVHAIGQVASCVVPWKSSGRNFGLALNTKLPLDITVTESVEVAHGFHAIRDAERKRYRYQLQMGGFDSPFERRFRWRLKQPLSLQLMQQAAKRLVGEHDFVSFQAAGSERATTVRTIFECVVYPQRASDYCDGLLLAIEIEANGFLYNMVRNIVGSLVEVGLRRKEVDWISSVLEAKDRTKAGPTAPAHGLFLVRVKYPPSIQLESDAFDSVDE